MNKVACAVINSCDPRKKNSSGIATVIKNLISCSPPGFRFTIIGLGSTKDKLFRPIRITINNRYVNFIPVLNTEKKNKLPTSFLFMLTLMLNKKKLLLENYDIFHFHRIDEVIPFVNLKAKKICIHHVSMSEYLDKKKSEVKWAKYPWLYYLVERIAVKNTDKFITVSYHALDYFKKKYPSHAYKFHFMPNIVDSNVFQMYDEKEKKHIRQSLLKKYNIPSQKKLIIFVGRFDKAKRPLFIIDVFKNIKRSLPDVMLLMIGDGSMYDSVYQKIYDIKLQNDIQLIESISSEDVAGFMHTATMLLLLSHFEATPMVVLEALATGTPVLSTAVGQVPCIIKPGVNGELVNADADATEIAGVAIGMIKEIEKYSPEKCSESVLEFQSDFDFVKLLT